MAQVKPAPKLGKKTNKKVEKEAEKKKRKPYYKEVKTEIRGPAYWKEKMAADARLFITAQGIWNAAVGRKAAEYRKRRAAKECKGRRSLGVSQGWMKEKERLNQKAHHKKQNKRQRFVRFNKSYTNKRRVGYFPKNIRPLHRRRLGRRENFAILKRIVEESDHIQRNGPKETRESKTRARPARKEVKKTWRAKEQNARNEVDTKDENTL